MMQTVALKVQVCPAKRGFLGWGGNQDEKMSTVHVSDKCINVQH